MVQDSCNKTDHDRDLDQYQYSYHACTLCHSKVDEKGRLHRASLYQAGNRSAQDLRLQRHPEAGSFWPTGVPRP